MNRPGIRKQESRDIVRNGRGGTILRQARSKAVQRGQGVGARKSFDAQGGTRAGTGRVRSGRDLSGQGLEVRRRAQGAKVYGDK